ncbi:MAG TPA: hypothetical protein DIW43_12615 [Spongiibacteraceae bacterium]|nr:hypothetical protein [Spongiibacteraceae bacterium]
MLPRISLQSIDPRALLTGLLIVLLCAAFWSGSRYPSLEGKANSNPDSALQTSLGFERHFAAPAAGAGYWSRVGYETLEWLATNRQGMTFGILLAAAILTLLPLLKPASPDSRFSALRGALVGAPMGVCVNCAAPIGIAMLRGGSRAEMALAVMISSPSLNVVVLGMLFALFPWYFIAIKLASVVLLIFVAVPLSVRFSGRPLRQAALEAAKPRAGLFAAMNRYLSVKPVADAGAASSWPYALLWVARNFGGNLVRISLLVLPLMILSGFLGSAAAEALPWGQLAGSFAQYGWLAAVSLLGVSALGLFVPAPIAFDIILCAMLVQAGVEEYVVAALLVTLGAFSVYPWLLLGKFWSWRGANLLALAVLGLGVLGGASGHYLAAAQLDSQRNLLASYLAEETPFYKATPENLPSYSGGEIAARITASPVCKTTAGEGYAIRFCPNGSLARPGDGLSYERVDAAGRGVKLGLGYNPEIVSVLHLPYYGGLAAGDANRDGWPDLVVGTAEGPRLYINTGGAFLRQRLPLANAVTGPVALTDLDADGWPELVYAAFGGLYEVRNRGGAFADEPHRMIAELPDRFVSALAIADFNRDGLLDIVIGSALGINRHREEVGAAARTLIAYAQPDDSWSVEELDGPGGETLSLAAHDIDGDGWIDLYEGNDFGWPNIYYRNIDGRLVAQTRTDRYVPGADTATTMSVSTATLEGDDRLYLYSAQISRNDARMGADRQFRFSLSDDCAAFIDPKTQRHCSRYIAVASAIDRALRKQRLELCSGLDPVGRLTCVGRAARGLYSSMPSTCDATGGVLWWNKRECSLWRRDFHTDASAHLWDRDWPATENGRNLAFVMEQGQWREVPGALDAGFGAWSWNAEFVDADADGYQDLVISNGYWSSVRTGFDPIFYRGDGSGFERLSDIGLEYDLPTTAHLTLDFDRDGDLDIVALSPHVGVLWFEATQTRGQIVEFSFDSSCRGGEQIGAALVAHAGDHVMTRHLRASGGYSSLPPTAAIFGLGEREHIDRVVLQRAGDSPIAFEGPFRPGRHTVCLTD